VWHRVFPKDPEAIRLASWETGDLPRVQLADVFPGIENTSVSLERAYDRTMGTSIDVMEVMSLVTLIKHTKATRVLEIGTFDGNTALNIAANLPAAGTVVTVDLPEDWQGDLTLEIPDEHINVTDRQGVGRQYRQSAHASKVRQVLGDSAKLDWSTLGGPFDVIFIDGCHAYPYVVSDSANALKCLRPGGVIVWHDYGQIPDVSQRVDELAHELKGQMTLHSVRGTRLAIGLCQK
jgi:predicted O-methyltransferase YrrM